jgi:molecular chaperone GrpE
MPRGSAQPEHGNRQLATLTEEVAQLRDLFQRRLLDDKAKNRLYDELYEQLTVARGGLAEQLLTPLFHELLLVIDRIASPNHDGDVVLESITEELLELLARRNVHRVPVMSTFDPSIHEAVRAEPRDDQAPGTILEVLRPGYLHSTNLLRAERVVVAALDPAARDRPASAGGLVSSEKQRSADMYATGCARGVKTELCRGTRLPMRCLCGGGTRAERSTPDQRQWPGYTYLAAAGLTSWVTTLSAFPTSAAAVPRCDPGH